MVETGTSSYYTALGEATSEPVLKQVCKLIAADEYRHFKLFYDHMRRYLSRENLGMMTRLRIALGRIGESEDDELAYAYHCGNQPESQAFQHDRCTAAYMAGAWNLSLSAHRTRHRDDPQNGRSAAPRSAFQWRDKTGLASAAMAPTPLRPATRGVKGAPGRHR